MTLAKNISSISKLCELKVHAVSKCYKNKVVFIYHILQIVSILKL